MLERSHVHPAWQDQGCGGAIYVGGTITMRAGWVGRASRWRFGQSGQPGVQPGQRVGQECSQREVGQVGWLRAWAPTPHTRTHIGRRVPIFLRLSHLYLHLYLLDACTRHTRCACA